MAVMTKKHFEWAAARVARILNAAPEGEGGRDERERARIEACAYAALFETFNGAFDRARFWAACGF